MEHRLYHEPLVDQSTCTMLLPATYIISKKVTEMFTPWKNNWKDPNYMKFAEGSPSTELYECYNIFLNHMPGMTDLYEAIVKKFKELNPKATDYAIAGWVNVFPKGKNLKWHRHGGENEDNGRWHGYVCIDAEPSQTMYKDKGFEQTIENKNGYITLNEAGLLHKVSDDWPNERPRVTIAFDFILKRHIHATNMLRWIPII